MFLSITIQGCGEKLAYQDNCAAKKCLQREQGKSNNIEYLGKHKKSLSVLCAGTNTCTLDHHCQNRKAQN